MPVSIARSFVRACLLAPLPALACLTLFTTPGSSAHGPAQPESPKAAPATEVEVKYIDDSTMKLKVLDDRLELITKYGLLMIPVADVRRIEFATRVPPDIAEKIMAAIGALGHPDFATRERATAELKGYRERAYPFVLRAVKHSDPEVGRRAEDVLRYLQAKVPPAQLEPRDHDVVHTEDSKFTGKLTNPVFRVHTFQFGEQTLKLADIRTLRSMHGVAADELAAAPPAPNNLISFQNQFGKEAAFQVTGAQPGGQGNGVWGTDVYTLDSNLGAAAVHAGVLQPGQAGVVRIRILAPPPQFVGSFRNGIGSSPYGNYPNGAFEFMRK